MFVKQRLIYVKIIRVKMEETVHCLSQTMSVHVLQVNTLSLIVPLPPNPCFQRFATVKVTLVLIQEYLYHLIQIISVLVLEINVNPAHAPSQAPPPPSWIHNYKAFI